MLAATILLIAVTAYATVGILFAIPFVCAGVTRIDPAADESPLGFRLLLLPGSVAFWPILAWKWRSAIHTRSERETDHS